MKDADKILKDPRDGQTYRTLKIGDQVWMAENLNYEYNAGSAKSYCYDDKIENCQKYGRLYTWSAAMDSAAVFSANGKNCGYNKRCSPTYPVQGVCPNGWHVPNLVEWRTLLGEADSKNLGIEGKLLKSKNGWSGNGNGTDSINFTVLPAGYHYYEKFQYEGKTASFWTSNDEHRKATHSVNFRDYQFEVVLLENRKNHAFSIRCIKD